VGEGQREPSLDLDLPAVAESPARARYAVRAALAGTGVDQGAVDLAVSEAVTNAVIHAYRDRDPAAAPGRVRLLLAICRSSVSIVVADDGVGMSPRPDSPGLGLGLPVIASVCDRLEVRQRTDGTEVHMGFELASEAHAGAARG